MDSDAPNRDTGEETSAVRDRPSPPGMPRWLKVSGIVVVVLILLVVAVSFITGVQHGPGRHGSSVDGHREAGMELQIVATPTDGDPRGAVRSAPGDS